MIASFGARLRSHREQRGIDLDTIARSTKISAGILEALERDDTSRWPSGIFRRAFIRAYATAVGLDPESTLSEFLERFPDPKDEECVADVARAHAVPRSSCGLRGEPLRLTLADEQRASALEGRTTNAVLFPRREPVEPLRLTLADELPRPIRSYVRALRSPWSRVVAAVCDLIVVVAIAAAVFKVAGAFWTPFTMTTVCYYFLGVLFVGTSPAAWIFGPGRRTPARSRRVASPERLSRPGGAEADSLEPFSPRRYPRAV
jgi:transcriptional regulator with XRE-family HTH domain